MNNMKISDLNYCETSTGNKSEILGGNQIDALSRQKRLLSLWFFAVPSLKSSSLGDFESTEIETNSGYTVNKLENPITGESGFQVTGRNGKHSSFVLFSPYSRQSFSIAIS
ncbi:MAG: hypothetical protein AAFR77_20340 [Cyanobacteria bacterium J06631_2]